MSTKAEKVRKSLEEKLEDADPGTPVSPERALADFYSVDRSTVRTALAQLVAMGMLDKAPRGYQVAPSPISHELVPASKTDRHKEREQPDNYVVTVYAGRPVACTCRSFVYSEGKPCKHIRGM